MLCFLSENGISHWNHKNFQRVLQLNSVKKRPCHSCAETSTNTPIENGNPSIPNWRIRQVAIDIS